MLSPNKDIRKMIKQAQEHGWVFYRSKAHIRGKHPNGVKLITIAISPSDHRALVKIRKDLEL